MIYFNGNLPFLKTVDFKIRIPYNTYYYFILFYKNFTRVYVAK